MSKESRLLKAFWGPIRQGQKIRSRPTKPTRDARFYDRDNSRSPELLENHRAFQRRYVLPKGKAYRKALAAAVKHYDKLIASEKAAKHYGSTTKPRRLKPMTVDPQLQTQAKRRSQAA